MRKRQKLAIAVTAVTIGIAGVLRPASAASVTYDLNSVSTAYTGDNFSGSITYDTVLGQITAANITANIKQQDSTYQVEQLTTAAYSQSYGATYFTATNQSTGDYLALYFDQPLTGTLNETVSIEGNQAAYGVPRSYFHDSLATDSANTLSQSGSVTAVGYSQPAPEPATIMGTVAAIAMGVALRRKKRMISVLEKAHTAV